MNVAPWINKQRLVGVCTARSTGTTGEVDCALLAVEARGKRQQGHQGKEQNVFFVVARLPRFRKLIESLPSQFVMFAEGPTVRFNVSSDTGTTSIYAVEAETLLVLSREELMEGYDQDDDAEVPTLALREPQPELTKFLSIGTTDEVGEQNKHIPWTQDPDELFMPTPAPWDVDDARS